MILNGYEKGELWDCLMDYCGLIIIHVRCSCLNLFSESIQGVFSAGFRHQFLAVLDPVGDLNCERWG